MNVKIKRTQIVLGIFFILLLTTALTACGGRRNTPSQIPGTIYLLAVTSNSVYVMAESQDTVPLRVDYKPAGIYGNSAFTESTMPTTGNTYIHRIHLTGLNPDTTYDYRLGSHRARFRTAAKPGTAFRFAFMGDNRTGTAVHDAIAQMMLAKNPRFSLYGGDLCQDGRSYSSYKEDFFRPNQLKLAARVPFFNATGNHEKWQIDSKAFMLAPASSSDKQSYYSFDYGDLHVVVMNYKDPGGYKPGSPQYNFIAHDLKTTKKPWKIVTCHVPAYVAGGHGNNAEMIALTKNIFEPYGVDLVLTGHSHFYQRNFVNGIYHLTIGSAGAPLYEPGPVGGYTQVSLKSYCWAIFDLKPTSLRIHVYNEKGAEIDSISLSKDTRGDRKKSSDDKNAEDFRNPLLMIVAFLTGLRKNN